MKTPAIIRRKIVLTVLVVVFMFGSIFATNNAQNKKLDTHTVEISPTLTKEVKSMNIGISPTNASEEQIEENLNLQRESAKVVSVRDGDTIEVDFGAGEIKVVRYIGIDTPESVDPRRTVECFGKEASNINKSLVEGRLVQLEKDVSETDKYGRLLRYVYVGDLFINQYLVEEGFANASAYPPDIKYQEDLESAEEEARANNKGLWESCTSASNNSQRSGAQDSSGDKDCSDFSTHQEAQDYFVSKGGSATNNVDKLDGSDRDGLVCETLP